MKIDSKNNGESGFTSGKALAIVVVLSFLAGGLLVADLYKFSDNDETPALTSGSPGSQLDTLQKRVDSLENLIRECGIGENTGDNWSLDEIYQYSISSVVQIRAVKINTNFYGQQETQTSQGSGFVYDESGHIITNHHVIEGADEIQVRFCNGETVEAEVSGSDPYSDLAVLDISSAQDLDTTLNPILLGNSSTLEPGTRVLAIGSPFGLEGTATFGIVSQTGRVLSTGTRYMIPGVIQIDAPINPGNSGGPLLNMAGQVVGITTAIKSQTGTFSGIGYVVPSDLVRRVVEGIIDNGKYHHPKVGVTGRDVTYQIAQKRGMDRVRGFLIDSVEDGGPVDNILKSGDIVLGIDNREVMGIEDILSHIVLNKSPGDIISIRILRDGDITTVNVGLGLRPKA